MRNFLDGVFCILRVAHESEMFPNDFFASACVEACEVGIEHAPALDACGVFVAVGDVGATEGIRDDDFGF